ncbi:hypothetical protein SAMN05443573_11244 [Celeribacter indicus]|nr:hypothetical protein SAMN05443573_11244 [Celeribacter indicus]
MMGVFCPLARSGCDGEMATACASALAPARRNP